MAVYVTRIVLVAILVAVSVMNSDAKPNNNDNNIMRFESSPQSSFQGCLLSCLDKDLCCSCKEPGKLSMNAALINDLSKTCANTDVLKCSQMWVDSWMNADRSGASNCTSQDKVEKEVGRCVSQCNGKHWSKPLNPYRPELPQEHVTDVSDLFEYMDPDFTDFCNDIRAEGLLCTVFSATSYTAGNTLCRTEHTCGYHGQKYSWCYVDFSNHWDYCCTGTCGFGGGKNYMWCASGSEWQYCGKGGTTDIQGRKCTNEYPCGVHQEDGKKSYYWCYVDSKKNWDRCCQPWDTCSKKGEWYDWCYTGYKKKSEWRKCRALKYTSLF